MKDLELKRKYIDVLVPTRWCSVHISNTKYDRFKKAEDEANKKPVQVSEIINLTNEFLDKIGIKQVGNPRIDKPIIDSEAFYESMKEKYGLACRKDIVWMKFTKDINNAENGHLGVVGQGDDLHYQSELPENEFVYNATTDGKPKNKGNRWKYTTSSIIIHHLMLKEKIKGWDESFVLAYPLPNIPCGLDREKIETGIGNYLIDNSVPILDYYSHMCNIREKTK